MISIRPRPQNPVPFWEILHIGHLQITGISRFSINDFRPVVFHDTGPLLQTDVVELPENVSRLYMSDFHAILGIGYTIIIDVIYLLQIHQTG